MKTEKKDCPLCGAKEAITLTFRSPSMIAKRKNDPIEPEDMGFDRHDFSHAKECPALVGTHQPEMLLRYHTGYMLLCSSDGHSLEDYEKALVELGFTIQSGNEKVPDKGRKQWLYIDSLNVPGSCLLKTYGKDLSEAFDLLRHRLICGEMIIHEKLFFQLKPGMMNDPLVFIKPDTRAIA